MAPSKTAQGGLARPALPPRSTPPTPKRPENGCRQGAGDSGSVARRTALLGGLSQVAWGAIPAGTLTAWTPPARASLLQFPTAQTANNYFLVRAGETEAEALGYIDTNPVNKTSMINALSAAGKRQVLGRTLKSLKALDACDSEACWLWPSIAQNSYQTAEILASMLGLGRNRIVPEYSFLDARGLGAFDQLAPAEAFQRIHAVDEVDGRQRPPPTYTGTPNESAHDVLTRMRQLMSVTETQYNGATVVIVAPDSDTLSVLQAAMLGMDLEAHATLAFEPGEVRPLALSEEGPNMDPVQFACPNPPNCF